MNRVWTNTARGLLFIGLILVLVGQTCLGQLGSIPDRELDILYQKETSVKLSILTEGWSVGYDIGRIEKYYITTFKHISFGSIHHFKEFSNANNFSSNATTSQYYYGKQNSLYYIRAGKGRIRYLSDKTKRRGVAVGYSLEGGLTAGFLKPYYLKFERNIDGLTRLVEEKYSEENASEFLDEHAIVDASNFLVGITETKLIPGVHGKFATHFSLRANSSFVSAVDVGIVMDLFIRKVPLMILQKNRPYFFNLYVTLQLGKRE